MKFIRKNIPIVLNFIIVIIKFIYYAKCIKAQIQGILLKIKRGLHIVSDGVRDSYPYFGGYSISVVLTIISLDFVSIDLFFF